MKRTPRGWTGAVALAVALMTATGLAVLTGAPVALAATGSAPVTGPDSGETYPGNFLSLLPLANDSDPDGDEVALCRRGSESYRGIEADFQGPDLSVFVGPGAKPGTYTFTYYACDYSYLTPGTVTVTVKTPPHITVKKIPGRPGKLRVANPADFRISFLYAARFGDAEERVFFVPAGSSRVITVHQTAIGWVAYSRKKEFLAHGRVTGIRLPGGDRA